MILFKDSDGWHMVTRIGPLLALRLAWRLWRRPETVGFLSGPVKRIEIEPQREGA